MNLMVTGGCGQLRRTGFTLFSLQDPFGEQPCSGSGTSSYRQDEFRRGHGVRSPAYREGRAQEVCRVCKGAMVLPGYTSTFEVTRTEDVRWCCSCRFEEAKSCTDSPWTPPRNRVAIRV